MGFNCCNRAAQICRNPCSGRECTAKCTVRCGFLGGRVCDPVTCEVANPTGCTAGSGSGGSTSGCEAGYTTVGSKCYKVNTGPVNYLDAITSCIQMGATLASVESQAEHDAVTSYNNWMNNQPNNNNNNQHCVWIRPDGRWDDVTCKKTEAYVCQKTASSG